MRQRLALQRHEHLVGRSQCVDREHAEGRRAVEQDHVVGRTDLLERRPQRVLAACTGQQHRLASGELDGGRQQVHAVGCGCNGHSRGDAAEKHVVNGELDRLGVEAEREGEARLRVKVDHEHATPELNQRCRQRRDGRRLGHAALLVGNGDGPGVGHRHHCSGRMRGCSGER